MAELIDKTEVINKLIRLENAYQFYKNIWDAEVLYRRIAELEIGIAKTPGIDLVRCRDCKHFTEGMAVGMCKRIPDKPILPIPHDHFCSFGERKSNEQ